jgi:hypothetical protein
MTNRSISNPNNSTFELIHINNEKVKVRITLSSAFIVTLDFTFKMKHYSLELAPISNKEVSFNSNDINFKEIELHIIDKNNLANKVNQLLDQAFD